MDVLACVLAVLVGVLLWSMLSCARSYFERGRVRGIEETVREIEKGMSPLLDGQVPEDVQKGLKALQAALRDRPRRPSFGTDPIHAQLWVIGAALGEACWVKGHAAGVRRKAPAEGLFRIDLSVIELLQLSGLANLGFQYMMPNSRLLEIRRFNGKDDALDGTRAISKIEGAIPKVHRPDLLSQAENRERLITDWWRPKERASA